MLHRRIPFRTTTTILPDLLLSSAFVRLELCDLGTVHVFHDIVRLPFLERETQSFVGVIFVIGLVLVILDADEVRIDRLRIQRQGDEGVDGRRLGNDLERPRLGAVSNAAAV